MENTNCAVSIRARPARGIFKDEKQTYILQTIFGMTLVTWNDKLITGLPNTEDVHETGEDTENLPRINARRRWSVMMILHLYKWQHGGSTTFKSMKVVQDCYQSLTFLSQNVIRMTAALICVGVDMLH